MSGESNSSSSGETTNKILIANPNRFKPGPDKPVLSSYQRRLAREMEKKRKERLEQNAPYPSTRPSLINEDAREIALQKTMNLVSTTPVKTVPTIRDDIFTPGEYNPLSHDLVEVPPTPEIIETRKQLTFDDDELNFGLDFKEEDEFKEIGGRKKRRTTHKSKKSKKTRKSKRKTRKVRRHRRH